MISVMLFMLQTGDMQWITMAPVQCEAIRAHVRRGHEISVPTTAGPVPIKAAYCTKVDNWDEIYAAKMRWLREDGDDE